MQREGGERGGQETACAGRRRRVREGEEGSRRGERREAEMKRMRV